MKFKSTKCYSKSKFFQVEEEKRDLHIRNNLITTTLNIETKWYKSNKNKVIIIAKKQFFFPNSYNVGPGREDFTGPKLPVIQREKGYIFFLKQ